MSAAPSGAAGPRILVIGGDSDVMEAMLGEVVAAGLDARGSVDPDTVLERFDPAAFDLVAFGGGIAADRRKSLQRDFRLRNPDLKFIRTWAPHAAADIIAAARGAAAGVDLQAYCARIGHDGPLTPTLATLGELQARHQAAIPFEAIDVLLGRGIDLAPEAIDGKLIAAARGGYCFEQNGLFRRVLSAVGFEVENLAASVRWMSVPGTVPAPRTHRVLRVTLDGVPWLVDVGFGSAVPAAPLRMDLRDPQPTIHETYRIIPFGGGSLLQLRAGDRWFPLYDISAEPWHDSQFELPNWYTSTHPNSHFRRDLVVARTTAEARYGLRNGRFTVRRPDGTSERRHLSADGIERMLGDLFGLPVDTEWRPILEKAAAAPDPAEPAIGSRAA